MTDKQILSILPAMSALNSWCRVPFEKQLGMYEAVRSIYAYKLRIIAAAFALSMTDLKPVLVPATCKACKGTGTYVWEDWYDEYNRDYQPCRKCNSTGKVTLHFVESNIGGYRWHSPLPHWNHAIRTFTPDDWKTAETSEWTPGGEGKELGRFEFIGLINHVESAIAGDKFIRYGSNGWRSLHLGDMTWKGCIFCGLIEYREGRQGHAIPPFAGELYRPGFRWKQPECCRHHHRGPRCNLPLTWPHNLKPHWHRSDDPHAWYEHAPIPEEAYRPEVQEWLARRGIVIGLLPPEECAFTPQGIFVKVLAATPARILVRYYDSKREFDGMTALLPSRDLTPRPVQLLEAASA